MPKALLDALHMKWRETKQKTCDDFSGDLMGNDDPNQWLTFTHALLQYDFAVPNVGEEN